MATPARASLARAAAWAADEPALRAAIVFGSVARGRDDELSDLDLILVAEPGQRDALWARRVAIAATVLGAGIVSAQEPTWQAEYRYQACTADADTLDLTVAEGEVDVFGGVARGFIVLVDRADVAARLRAVVEDWRPPVFDAPAADQTTWGWLRYLQGRLRKGERFAVRAGLHDTLMYRVIPMLGGEWHSAEAQLGEADLRRVHDAMPRSSQDAELARALRDTAAVYDWALDRWAERTGRDRPRHPLAPLTRARLDANTDRIDGAIEPIRQS